MLLIPLLQAEPVPPSSNWSGILLLAIIIGIPILFGFLIKPSSKKSNPDVVTRHPLLTGLLYLAIAANGITFISSIFIKGTILWVAIVSALLTALAIASLVLILVKKKTGFYLCILSSIASAVIRFCIGGNYSAFMVLLVPVVWFLFLQLNSSDGKPYWEHMS